VTAATLTEIDRILAATEEADDALRDVVSTLVARAGCLWAGILFSEAGDLMLGPEAGASAPEVRTHVPVVFQGSPVAELVVDGCDDTTFLTAVADRLSAHCLVGWDTGGIPWDPDA